jgi:hypothetical protein
VIPCDKTQCGNLLRDGQRHACSKYDDGAGSATEVDELTHEAYWDNINFKDPCTHDQQRVFKKCNAQCGSIIHESQKDANGKGFTFLGLTQDMLPMERSTTSGRRLSLFYQTLC